MNEALGNISPWSHVPYDYSDSDDNMNFRQRLTNIMDIMYDKIIRRFKYWPKMQAIAEKHFSHLEGKSILLGIRNILVNIWSRIFFLSNM